MCSCVICPRNFAFTNFACSVGSYMPLISFCVQNSNTLSNSMALKKSQVVLATVAKTVSTSTVSRDYRRHDSEKGKGDNHDSTRHFLVRATKGPKRASKA